jgi:hypothetical protein
MLTTKDLTQPDIQQKENYEQALKLGLEVFARKAPEQLAANAGARFEDRRVIVPHLDKEIIFETDSHRSVVSPEGEDAPIWLAILTVHYLNNATGSVPSGKLKHFREFKEGSFYEPAFNSRTKDVLISIFGKDPAPMVIAGQKLNGKVLDQGDASVELRYFPYVPITCIMWAGDDEFPPEAAVLFDETVDQFLCAEDMAVAGQMAVLELLKASRG